jgi:disulfide bond formation protein DsbB
VNVGLAVIHVGVEQHLWQNPINECAAPHFGGMTLMDRLLDLSSRPPQPCDRASYLIPFLPLSMAAMNALFAAAFAGLLAVFLLPRMLRFR